MACRSAGPPTQATLPILAHSEAHDAPRRDSPARAPWVQCVSRSTHGGRTDTGLNALEWAQRGVELGAGEILLTSWDRDGTREGFDIELTRAFTDALTVPVIASGGADGPHSFVEVFEEAAADAALAASIFHDGHYTVEALKRAINEESPVALRYERNEK